MFYVIMTHCSICNTVVYYTVVYYSTASSVISMEIVSRNLFTVIFVNSSTSPVH